MFEKLRYFRQTKNITLKPDEKLLIHEHLKSFMQTHPVRTIAGSRQLRQEAPIHFLSSLKSMLLKPLPITLSALLLLGGGTAFAAEQALPDEALYPIKLQVNERVRATFTPTSEGKAKWEVRVAERRLEEIEKLAAEKKLTAETQAQVETTFDLQTKLIQEKIARLKAEGNINAAAELSESFQMSLQTHETILTKLDAENIDTNAMDPLLEKIKLNATVMTLGADESSATATMDTQAELKAQAYKKQQAASDAIANVKQNLNESIQLDVEIKAKITTLLQLSLDAFSKGTDQFNQLEFKLAVSQYGQAETSAQEALRLIASSQTDIKANAEGQVIFETPLKQDSLIIKQKAELNAETKLDPLPQEPPKETEPTFDPKQSLDFQDKAKLDLSL